ncbi:MAG: Hsp20/alpha crystallin family protein [Spirochaetales bacterium]
MAKELENKTRRVISPVADICEAGGKVILRLEMPGVSKDNLEVKIENDELIIEGKRDPADTKGRYIIRERRIADFARRYTLDDTIDREKVEAVIKNGILHLTLHLKEASKPKKIEVKGG